ncbi:unnamed protein product [Diamesa hyperborea]
MLWKLSVCFIILIVPLIVSGSSCVQSSEIKFQQPYYLRFNKGFFYIHGLTNGESVVIYKLPGENGNLIGHYTFLTSNCLYKTHYYRLSTNGKYVNEEPSLSSYKDFEIDSKLFFNLDGVEKLINYKINAKKGYSIYTDIEPSESINLASLISVPASEFNYHNVSESMFLDNEQLQYTTINDGRLFYQIYNLENLIINGHYTLRTSDEKYHTINYSIIPFKRNNTIDPGKSDFNNEDKYDTDKPSFELNCSEKKLSYKINKYGFEVQSNIKKSTVALNPSIKQGLHKQNTNEIKTSLEDYDFVYEFKLTYLNDGRYFYQTVNLPDSIDGAYTFKTSDNKYHSLNYMISRPFNQELGSSAFEVGSYTVADEESYYDGQNEIVLVNGEQKRLIYFFDSNGIHIKGFKDDSNFGVNYPHIGMSN